MTLVACSRMYDVAPAARDAWDALFAAVARRAGVDLRVIRHPAPAPLAELWARADLGAAFMCGWPFAMARPQPKLVAAPVPAGPDYGGAPIYFTDLVVRRESPFRRLEDTFGGRLGWTSRDSHSGFNALRRHLIDRHTDERPRLYSETVGPLLTPLAAAQSVVDDRADVAPLDSYAHDLIRLHRPDLADRLRVVDRTAPAPIPPMVASAAAPEDAVIALSRALLAFGENAAEARILAALALKRFVRPDPAAYRLQTDWAAECLAKGYGEPA